MPSIDRRRFVIASLAALGMPMLSGCQWLMRRVTKADNSGFTPVSHSFETSDVCALNAEAMPGPFYIPETLVRRSIAEGHPGAPLRLRFKVVDVAGCRPLPGALVEIWHCDAEGAYSGYPGYPPDRIPMMSPSSRRDPTDEERFCRGIQIVDAGGFVEFETIVPGWYAPRTPHVHVRVSRPEELAKAPGEDVHLLTNQVYFPDELIAGIHRSEPPYASRGVSPYTNLNDAVIHASRGADGGFLRMSRDGAWHVGTLTLAVDA